jgi:hypothetical protein
VVEGKAGGDHRWPARVDLTQKETVAGDVTCVVVDDGVLPEPSLRLFLATTSGNRG